MRQVFFHVLITHDVNRTQNHAIFLQKSDSHHLTSLHSDRLDMNNQPTLRLCEKALRIPQPEGWGLEFGHFKYVSHLCD
jgi:hypothetical protein